ncbi:MAG TPA: GNAT family N-acetyltransferase, partial [Verrucomicrobiae bacterium]|nr:GNAT family N-acetyltransferase [Verrucomicrobiae bacterium]
MHHSWSKGDFEVSTDPERVDIDVVHDFLTRSYWAQGIPMETVRRSIENSICFGIYHGRQQVGFARIVSDQATFAYLADVFVLPEYRGRGLSRWLMNVLWGILICKGCAGGCWPRATRMGCTPALDLRQSKNLTAGWSSIVRKFTQKPAAAPFRRRA